MQLIEETRRVFEEYLAVAHEGLARHDYFTEESVNVLTRSLQRRTEALRETLRGGYGSSPRNSIIEKDIDINGYARYKE